MKIEFIGIGGAFNTELGCNCAYIKDQNKILFIDMGLDSFEKIIKYKILDDINEIYVILTHLHGDHVGGLATFIQYAYICLEKRVNIFINSKSFNKDLYAILKAMGVDESNYKFIDFNKNPFPFKMNLKRTTHTSLLECYSIIFDENGNKTFYTGDSNDIDFLKSVVNDSNFIKIYTEVGESKPHMNYSIVKTLSKEKLFLMHIESKQLLEKIILDGFKMPEYLK